jgi:hypothetical protein
MPGPIGVLDRVSPEQQNQILHWLDIYPDRAVLEKIAAPPPDGFGVATHITSLRRFQARKQRDDATEILELARTAAAESSVTEEFITASGRLLAEKAFELISAPGVKPKQFAAVARWITRLRDQELKSEALRLARQRLSLERRRAQFHAGLKEAQSPTEHQETLINAARERCFGTKCSD